ncbi:hypothetical protein D9M71_524020 [compost metagenome]
MAVMKLWPSATPPSIATTLLSGTPLQNAQPAAPTVQGVPLAPWGKNARPLPEHCSTLATVVTPRDLSSARVRLRGCLTPWKATVHPSRSARMDASGAGRLLRTNSRLLAVITLVPTASRWVSSVLALCTISASGVFHFT